MRLRLHIYKTDYGCGPRKLYITSDTGRHSVTLVEFIRAPRKAWRVLRGKA